MGNLNIPGVVKACQPLFIRMIYTVRNLYLFLSYKFIVTTVFNILAGISLVKNL